MCILNSERKTSTAVFDAFTLASSCSTSTNCECGEPVLATNGEDIIIFFASFPAEQTILFFESINLKNAIPLFQLYVDDPTEDNRLALAEIVYPYYRSNPEAVTIDCEAILEIIIEGTPSGDCNFTPVSCPSGDDIFNIFETCNSDKPVAEYFRERQMNSVVTPYEQWKANRGSKQLENAYRTQLYLWYENNPDSLDYDCSNFINYCKNWKAPCTDPTICNVPIPITPIVGSTPIVSGY